MSYNVYIACDKCGRCANWVNYTVNYSNAVRLARSWGWQVGKKGWFCSECKQKANRKTKGGDTDA